MSDIEAALKSALNRLLKSTPRALAESIEYSLLGGGKRIRPRLVQATSTLLCLPDPVIAAASVAIEMIHCYSLIHDDLPCLDNDDFRRGRPSNHKRFGEATALLAGDALISLAFETLLEAETHLSESTRVLRAIRRLSWASGPRGMVGGQASEAELGPDSTLVELRRMHAGKTGALFVASLLVPADLAGLPETSCEHACLLRLAQRIGSAFQVADDLEDSQEMSDPSKAFLSVLQHLNPAEACRIEVAQLNDSRAEVLQLWPEKLAYPLLQICDEVVAKLKAASS